ncbi:hypothetical protein [Nocardia wallacei]|uniref:hypothetical protein n=1 Tax=Nocardia wallacei TaxID=480035 RepID=UPI00245603F9|nr:hypothetical protein [Nocardia wallacei]
MTYTNPKTGRTLHAGQVYRDARTSNIRTLRVNAVRESDGMADCTVILQEYEGTVTTPNRPTSMTVDRITGRAFVLVAAAQGTGDDTTEATR